MDVPRKNAARNRLIKRLVIGGISLAAIAGIGLYVYRLKPAAPPVDKGAVWMDTVKRGQMLREVRGVGSLVPEEILHVPATYGGRVERIPVLAGINVTEDTLLVELRNTDMEQQEVDARNALQTAQSDLANLKANIETQRLQQRATIANTEAQYKNAKAKAEHDEILYKEQLLLELDYNVSKTNYEQLATQLQIAQDQSKTLEAALAAQLEAKESRRGASAKRIAVAARPVGRA